MKNISAIILMLAATDASAQAISARVGGAGVSVGGGSTGSIGAGSAAAGGAASGGAGSSSGAANPWSALNEPSAGGQLPGTYDVTMGGKIIQFRGAVGFGDDRSNFRAGAGIPF